MLLVMKWPYMLNVQDVYATQLVKNMPVVLVIALEKTCTKVSKILILLHQKNISIDYLNWLMNSLLLENRDAVGATTSVLKKISSEARLVQQEHTDLVTSLTILRKKLIDRQDKHKS